MMRNMDSSTTKTTLFPPCTHRGRICRVCETSICAQCPSSYDRHAMYCVNSRHSLKVYRASATAMAREVTELCEDAKSRSEAMTLENGKTSTDFYLQLRAEREWREPQVIRPDLYLITPLWDFSVLCKHAIATMNPAVNGNTVAAELTPPTQDQPPPPPPKPNNTVTPQPLTLDKAISKQLHFCQTALQTVLTDVTLFMPQGGFRIGTFIAPPSSLISSSPMEADVAMGMAIKSTRLSILKNPDITVCVMMTPLLNPAIVHFPKCAELFHNSGGGGGVDPVFFSSIVELHTVLLKMASVYLTTGDVTPHPIFGVCDDDSNIGQVETFDDLSNEFLPPDGLFQSFWNDSKLDEFAAIFTDGDRARVLACLERMIARLTADIMPQMAGYPIRVQTRFIYWLCLQLKVLGSTSNVNLVANSFIGRTLTHVCPYDVRFAASARNAFNLLTSVDLN